MLNFTLPEPIKLKPKIMSQNSKFSKIEKESVIFRCEATGVDQGDEIVWDKLDSNIDLQNFVETVRGDGQINSELSLNDLKRSDAGSFRCSLKSDLSNSYTFILTVNGPPQKPTIKNVLIRPDGSTLIDWNVNDLGGAEHLRNVFIRYSPNFSNKNLAVKNSGNCYIFQILKDFKDNLNLNRGLL